MRGTCIRFGIEQSGMCFWWSDASGRYCSINRVGGIAISSALVLFRWILGVECYKDAPFKIQGSQGFVFSGSSAVAAHEYCIGFFHGKCERDDTRLVQRLERRVDVVTESFSNARIQDLKLPTSVTHSKCLLSARDSFDPPTG
eukprot:m.493271 g.493271  ORF g.493271 m.493271 type:complete len:143 (+) comp21792_c0_seq17:1969-2397(+)